MKEKKKGPFQAPGMLLLVVAGNLLYALTVKLFRFLCLCWCLIL